MTTEIIAKDSLSSVRYGQCWEDADILLKGLAPAVGDRCLSIGSAGDNAIALLIRDPSQVVAVDLNPAQIACLEIRVAAYRVLDHAEFLELYGSRPSRRRRQLYQRCRPEIRSAQARDFWDGQIAAVEIGGFAGIGKLEQYMGYFRRYVLPLIHPARTILELLTTREQPQRKRFYAEHWDGWRWRLLFRLFFSRTVMARLGRTKAFFDYVEGSVADHLLARTRFAMTELDPAENPYLTWILTGTHGAALPVALRSENFDRIRINLNRLDWRVATLENVLDEAAHSGNRFQRFNLSDVFEYMSETNQRALLERLLRAAGPGSRLLYWNMMVPRRRPKDFADRLISREADAERLHRQDKAFFYRAVVIEDVA